MEAAFSLAFHPMLFGQVRLVSAVSSVHLGFLAKLECLLLYTLAHN